MDDTGREGPGGGSRACEEGSVVFVFKMRYNCKTPRIQVECHQQYCYNGVIECCMIKREDFKMEKQTLMLYIS